MKRTEMSSTTALRPDLTPTVDLRRPPSFPACPAEVFQDPSLPDHRSRLSTFLIRDLVWSRAWLHCGHAAGPSVPSTQPFRSTTVAVRQPDGVTAKATALASRFHAPGAVGGPSLLRCWKVKCVRCSVGIS